MRPTSGPRQQGDPATDHRPLLTTLTLHCKLLCMNTDHENGSAAPAEMARLIAEQQGALARRDARLGSGIMAAWGVVWIVGYLVVWSGPLGGNPWLRLPLVGVIVAVAVLNIAAAAASGVIGARMGRGVRGPSARAGAIAGWSIFIAMAAVVAVTAALGLSGVDAVTLGRVFPAAFSLVIALALMLSTPAPDTLAPFFAGTALIVAAVAATFIGAPHHWLLFSASGAVFLIGAATAARSPR